MEAAAQPWPALGVLLLRDGLVTKEELESVLDEQVDNRQQRITSRRLGEILVERGMVTETQVAQLVAEQYELPFVDLHVADIDLSVAGLLDEGLAHRFSAVAVGTRSDGCYLVAIADPSTVLFSDELRRPLGGQPTFVVVGQAAIDAAFEHVYREHADPSEQLSPDEIAPGTTVDPEMGVLLELPPPDAPAREDHRWPPLGALLVREGLVSEADLEAALAQQRLSSSLRLGEILVDRGTVTPSDVARLVAEQYELPFVDLREVEIEREAALLLDEKIARRRSALPVERLPDGSLRVVLADPTNVFQSDELRSALGASLVFCVAAPEQIEAAIGLVHGVPATSSEPDKHAPVGREAPEHEAEQHRSEESAAEGHAPEADDVMDPEAEHVAASSEEPESLEQEALEPETWEPMTREPETWEPGTWEPEAEAAPAAGDGPAEPDVELPPAHSGTEIASLFVPETGSPEEGASEPEPEPDSEPGEEDRESTPAEPAASAEDEPAPELADELLAEVEQTIAVVLDAPAEQEPAADPGRTDDLADELDEALARALSLGAASIQVTPRPAGLSVRARIAGSMHDLATLSVDTGALAARPVEDLARRAGIREPGRGPRRGLLVVEHEGRSVPLEASTLPTTLGLQLGLRVAGTGSFETLSDLGLPPPVESELRAALRQPRGALLVCGPPLSGRTTTLYAALRELVSPERALATVESPVERLVSGVDQTEVDAAAGVTYASGLRALLHAGADTLVVGELTDEETARVAFRGARAERVLLATLEAPTSTAALERLTGKLAVEPRLASTTLTGVVAQHLVRRICADCRESYYASAEEIAGLGRPDEESGRRLLARGRGCASCAGTGYAGWAAVYEALPLTEDMRVLIAEGADPRSLREAAVAAGMATVRDGAVGLCLDGVTTTAEVLQVPRD